MLGKCVNNIYVLEDFMYYEFTNNCNSRWINDDFDTIVLANVDPWFNKESEQEILNHLKLLLRLDLLFCLLLMLSLNL